MTSPAVSSLPVAVLRKVFVNEPVDSHRAELLPQQRDVIYSLNRFDFIDHPLSLMAQGDFENLALK